MDKKKKKGYKFKEGSTISLQLEKHESARTSLKPSSSTYKDLRDVDKKREINFDRVK